MKLTGKVFRKELPEGSDEKPSFQLEAEINGELTRLQAEGEVPEACLFDRRHSGLKITKVLESLPPQYLVQCGCGYSVSTSDINFGYPGFQK